MIHIFIPFTVKPDSLEYVKILILDFISAIKKNESGTLMYKSYQQKEDPTKFIHVMTFVDEKSQTKHRQTSYCKYFVEKLYPLCTEMPSPAEYNEIT